MIKEKTVDQRARPTLTQVIAALTMLVVFGTLSFFGTDFLQVPKVVAAAMAYLIVMYIFGLLELIRNPFNEGRKYRKLLGTLLTLIVFCFIIFPFFVDNQLIMKRLFTIAPLLHGIFWIVYRDNKEILKSPSVWQWSDLDSSRLQSYAALVHGSALVAIGLVNEMSIFLANDLVWVLSLAFTPIILRWCSSVLIIRGLLRREAT